MILYRGIVKCPANRCVRFIRNLGNVDMLSDRTDDNVTCNYVGISGVRKMRIKMLYSL
jgi:hypothetical protein